MEGRRPEGQIKNSRNKRLEETSRRQRRMEASSVGGQDQEGVVAPQMEFFKNFYSSVSKLHFLPLRKHTFHYVYIDEQVNVHSLRKANAVHFQSLTEHII